MGNSPKTETLSAELEVDPAECENLAILSRGDLIFAVVYGVLFLFGFIMTLVSI